MIIAISDIHGQMDKLLSLASRLSEHGYAFDNQEHTFVFLGDYVDGGPDTKKVIHYLRFLDASLPNVVCLKGNHEDMLLDAVRGEGRYQNGLIRWWHQGGAATAWSYKQPWSYVDVMIEGERVFGSDLNWMASLPISYDTRKFYFVHAGVYPGPFDLTSHFDKMWLRSKFYDSDYKWEKYVVAGHTYQPVPLIKDNLMVIDTMHHGHGVITSAVLNDDTGEIVEIITSDD